MLQSDFGIVPKGHGHDSHGKNDDYGILQNQPNYGGSPDKESESLQRTDSDSNSAFGKKKNGHGHGAAKNEKVNQRLSRINRQGSKFIKNEELSKMVMSMSVNKTKITRS